MSSVGLQELCQGSWNSRPEVILLNFLNPDPKGKGCISLFSHSQPSQPFCNLLWHRFGPFPQQLQPIISVAGCSRQNRQFRSDLVCMWLTAWPVSYEQKNEIVWRQDFRHDAKSLCAKRHLVVECSHGSKVFTLSPPLSLVAVSWITKKTVLKASDWNVYLHEMSRTTQLWHKHRTSTYLYSKVSQRSLTGK